MDRPGRERRIGMLSKEEIDGINAFFNKTFGKPSTEEVINTLEDIIETFSDDEDADWRRALRYAIGCVKEKDVFSKERRNIAFTKEEMEGIIRAIEEETKWIAVKFDKGRSNIPWEMDGKWIIVTDGSCISVERIKKDAYDYFYPDGRWFELEDAVAWMALPEPPKEIKHTLYGTGNKSVLYFDDFVKGE